MSRLVSSRWTLPDAMLPDRPIRVRPLTLGELVVLILVAWALWAMGANAQLIPVKTVPLTTGSQFQLYPSHARGMGGVALAVDDTLGDAFVNPAMAARLDGTWAYGAPRHYQHVGPAPSVRSAPGAGGLAPRRRPHRQPQGPPQDSELPPDEHPPRSGPIVNDFTFANTPLRTGLRHRQAWWELQLGLNVRTLRYWLTQNDRIEQSKRDQYETGRSGR